MDETRRAVTEAVKQIGAMAAAGNPVGLVLATREFNRALTQHELAVAQEFGRMVKEEFRSER